MPQYNVNSIDYDCKYRQSPQEPDGVPQDKSDKDSQKDQQQVLLAALTRCGQVEDSTVHRTHKSTWQVITVFVPGFFKSPFVRVPASLLGAGTRLVWMRPVQVEDQLNRLTRMMDPANR